MDIVQASRMHIKNHKRQYTAKNGMVFKCVHEDGCYPHLAAVIEPFDPSFVIELGTSWGGLTKFFEDHTRAYIYSYDRPGAPRKPNTALFSNRVIFKREGVLSQRSTGISYLCGSGGTTLLYTDNGCKVREVNLYAPYLKSGDMLGVHDWPREIYYDYKLLKPAARRHVLKADIDKLNAVLADFNPVYHDEFLQLGLSTRFWIKK